MVKSLWYPYTRSIIFEMGPDSFDKYDGIHIVISITEVEWYNIPT